MFLLITILIFITAFFAVFREESAYKNLFKMFSSAIAATVILIILNSQSPYGNILTMSLGVFIMYLGFSRLGMFKIINNNFLNNLSVHLILLILLSIQSDFSILYISLIILLFIIFYYAMLIILREIVFKKIRNRKDFKHLLELVTVIDGIFLFILGFVLAIDRIEFLEKIGKTLF